MDDEMRVDVRVKWEVRDGNVWHKKFRKILLVYKKNGQQLLNDLIHGETYILGDQSPVERLLSRIQGPLVFAVLF